jgi:hypothetical protein
MRCLEALRESFRSTIARTLDGALRTSRYECSLAPSSSHANSVAIRLRTSQAWHFKVDHVRPSRRRHNGVRKSRSDLTIAECDERAVGVSDHQVYRGVRFLRGSERRFSPHVNRAYTHVRLEELMVAAAIGLGVAQRKVRIRQECLSLRTVIRVEADTDADRDVQI